MRLGAKLNTLLISLYACSLIILMTVWLAFLISYRSTLEETIRDELMQSGLETTDGISEILFTYIEKTQRQGMSFNQQVYELGLRSGYVFTLDYDGNILQSNQTLPEELNALITPDDIKRGVDDFIVRGQKEFIRDNFTQVINGQNTKMIPVRIHFWVIPNERQILAYGNSMHTMYARIKAVQKTLDSSGYVLGIIGTVLSLSTLLILVIFVSVAMNRIVTRPVRKITLGLERIDQPDAYRPIQTKTNDEFDEIGQAMDILHDRLHALIQETIQSEQNLRQIIDFIPDAIFVRDREGNFLLTNQAMANYYGVSVSELEGANTKNLSPFIENDFSEIRKEELNLISEHSLKIIDKEVRANSRGKELWMHVFKMPITLISQERAILGVISDITPQKNSEQTIRQLNRELQKRFLDQTNELHETTQALSDSQQILQKAKQDLINQERLASLALMTAGLSHELNTPLGIAITGISALKSDLDQTKSAFLSGKLTKSQFEEALDLTLESADISLLNIKRATTIASSFKEVASNQASNEPVKFNLKSNIDALLVSLHPNLKKTKHVIKVHWHENESVELFNYPGALSQLFINLINNALLHAFEDIENGVIDIDIETSAEQITLKFRDNGIGMTPATLSRMFEPFFTSKKGRGGTGLGMHIVKDIVEQQMQGLLMCESEIGEGTIFTIELPLQVEFNLISDDS